MENSARKWTRKMLIGLVLLVIAPAMAIYGYLQHPKFGQSPAGEHLAKIESSKNYADGQFITRRQRANRWRKPLENMSKFLLPPKIVHDRLNLTLPATE
jgi:hypothetical protein